MIFIRPQREPFVVVVEGLKIGDIGLSDDSVDEVMLLLVPCSLLIRFVCSYYARARPDKTSEFDSSYVATNARMAEHLLEKGSDGPNPKYISPDRVLITTEC